MLFCMRMEGRGFKLGVKTALFVTLHTEDKKNLLTEGAMI